MTHRILLSQTSTIKENKNHSYYQDKAVPAHAFNIHKGREAEVQIHSFLNAAIDGTCINLAYRPN